MPGLDPGIHPNKILKKNGLPGLRLAETALPGNDKVKPMLLIGPYDSPFVRRVAIAMRLYGIGFEHKPWSTFRDAEKIAAYNPLRRVPTVVLDSGEVLIESGIILDYLDEVVGEARAMIASRGEARRHQQRLCSLATGLGDKAVSLFFERVLRDEPSRLWVERCEMQISDALAALEKERAAVKTPYLFGGRIGHSDIAVACMLRLASEVQANLFDAARYPALAAHAAHCEALPPFKEIAQPLTPPKGN